MRATGQAAGPARGGTSVTLDDTDLLPQPVSIDLDRTRELRILWADGQENVYPLHLLRRECPCAGCRHERQQNESNPLRVVRPASEQREMVIAETATLVGRYALRIVWKDGHNAGIYDFALLRSLGQAQSRGAAQPAGGNEQNRGARHNVKDL